ncbi:MAG: hypothetical protein JKY19_06700 [Alcanivoracaceae bacterium]|nr:hypothetical protein [Alcanivoracaceae bacterium]
MDKKFTSGLVFNDTLQSIVENYKYFSLLAIIFTSLTFVVSLISTYISDDSIFIAFLAVIILVMIFVKLAIMIHQSILLKEFNLGNIFSWSAIELKFIAWGVAIYSLVGGSLGVFLAFIFPQYSEGNEPNAMMIILMLVLFIMAAIIISRLSLIFPGVAVGDKMSMSRVWKATKGKVGSLFFLVVGFPFITNKILGKFPEDGELWILLNTVISVFLIIFEVGIVSHCYHRLIESTEPEPSEEQRENIEQVL